MHVTITMCIHYEPHPRSTQGAPSYICCQVVIWFSPIAIIMAERATASTSTELKCSASKVFRVYMGKLMEAIQSADIPMVTVKLYSKEVISERSTRDKVLLPNLIKLEKNGILLTAVEDAIKMQPQVLLTLMDILNEFKPADLIAQEMHQKLGMLKCVSIKNA